jgi:prepilin-type processing-associated H-X9-DG protein
MPGQFIGPVRMPFEPLPSNHAAIWPRGATEPTIEGGQGRSVPAGGFFIFHAAFHTARPLTRRAYQTTALSDIRDGTSKTVMLGEVCIGANSSDLLTGTGVVGSINAASMAPAVCLTVIGPNGYTATVPNNWHPGGRWADACGGYTQFFMHAGPNTPRCGQNGETWTPVPASSYHNNGVNVAMCDGSTRFVSDTVDAGDPTVGQTNGSGQPQWYTGPSIRGVWGAMGTMRGNENFSLPD